MSKKSEKKGKDSKKPRSPNSVGSLAEGSRTKLWELFGQIEHEFEQLHCENVALRERVDRLELLMSERNAEVPSDPLPPLSASESHSHTATPSRKIKIKNSGQTITKKLKTYTPSLKNRSNLSVECVQVCAYSGHRDGVWQVAHARNGLPVIGSASADGTACLWEVDTGSVLMKYVGHSGSVNSIAFHPTEPLACTTSGDNTAHVWRCAVNLSPLQRQRSSSNTASEKMHPKQDSSGEDRNPSDEDQTDIADVQMSMLKVPLIILPAHRAPVMSCDWLMEGQQLVTASWDHTAKLWDFESGQVIHSLEGHDLELTHVCTHPTQQLVVTSSQDTTFRLWDFRAPPIHSVNVFQGHSKAVNSAVFSMQENVISGSDDHTVKIWDLRNMRSPLDSVRVDCGINRLSVSHDDKHALAVPLDNRHIKLYDLAGNRLAHLPRRHGQGHHRMVFSVAWSPDGHLTTERCNLFSAGFDNKVIGWKITF